MGIWKLVELLGDKSNEEKFVVGLEGFKVM